MSLYRIAELLPMQPLWRLCEQELHWLSKSIHIYAPASSGCPLDVLHYVLMRLPAPKVSLPACAPPALLALGGTNVGRSDLLPA